MLPLHHELKVDHADTQRGPQKQELRLPGQVEVHALSNKRTDLTGSIVNLRLHVAVVANRHTHNGETVAAVLYPELSGQRSNGSLVAKKPVTVENA